MSFINDDLDLEPLDTSLYFINDDLDLEPLDTSLYIPRYDLSTTPGAESTLRGETTIGADNFLTRLRPQEART